MPATIAAQSKPPVRPVAPMPVPLWERERLFQEPAWPEGSDLVDEDADEAA